MAAANLKAEIYGIKQVKDRGTIKAMVDKVVVPEFTPRSGVKISVTDAELEANGNSSGGKYCNENRWICKGLVNIFSQCIQTPNVFGKCHLKHSFRYAQGQGHT